MADLRVRPLIGPVALLGAAGLMAFGAPAAPPRASQPEPAATRQAPAADPGFPVVATRIVARYPHDRTAFTEGLVWHDGQMFESVGREGESDVRRVRLSDGKVLARAPIPASQFGEGLTAWTDRSGRAELVSLTWHGGIAHRWDPRTLKRRGSGRFEGEGWGLTTLGPDLVQSDGTPTLRFLDPATLKVRRRVTVTFRGQPLKDLNELEAVDGQLLANVWHSPYLVRIDPASGRVTGVADLSAIVREVGAPDPEAVANGIAWDARGRRLFVTGKLWPKLYEVTLDWPR